MRFEFQDTEIQNIEFPKYYMGYVYTQKNVYLKIKFSACVVFLFAISGNLKL